MRDQASFEALYREHFRTVWNVCLPNWFFTDEMDVHLKASAVTRLCWSLRYEYDGELYTGSTVLWVDYYTGEILGGDTTG